MSDLAAYFEDKHAIEQVYIRYCDIIDQKAFDQMTDVFTDDCIGDYRSTNGNIQEGLAPLIEHVTRRMERGSDCGPTHHNVCNFRVTVDGDTATSKAHFYVVHEGINRCAGEHYTCWA